MGAETLRRTAFDPAERRAAGVRFTEWQGWSCVASFGDAEGEHHAVRTACGVWDVSPLQKWWLTGPQALDAADRFFTNDMRSLQPGQLRYGAFCDDDGRMIGDGTLLAFRDGRLLMVTALASDGEALAEAAAGLE